VAVYDYQPFLEEPYEYYILGADSFFENFCWPGKSPFNYYLGLYPNNLIKAIQLIWTEV
jgi:hypothetical protein